MRCRLFRRFGTGPQHGTRSRPARILGVTRNPETAKERFLSSDEFRRLGEALARAETEGLPFEVNEQGPNAKHAPKPENRRRFIDPHAAAAIRLLILTGARLREILHARWENVDFERGILFLSDSKTGRKPIYLGSATLLILTNLPRMSGSPYVIAGATPDKPRSDLKNPWRAITKAAALEGLRIHDLRHSFASVGAGSISWATDHRKIIRPYSAIDDRPIRTSRLRSHEEGCRYDRRHHLECDEWQCPFQQACRICRRLTEVFRWVEREGVRL